MRLRAWFSKEKPKPKLNAVGLGQILLLFPSFTLCMVKSDSTLHSTKNYSPDLEDTCRTVKQRGQLNPEKINICYGQEHPYKGRALLIQLLPASKDGPTPFPCKAMQSE